MFAINHAATALVLKRRYPQVPMVPLLVSVQLVELAWVVLNVAGIERTATAPLVRTVEDIHLLYMPYSHSLATSLGLALLCWLLLGKVLRRHAAAAALSIGIASHVALDLLTHSQDIVLVPFAGLPRAGLGLYDVPLLAFAAETLYGLLCWTAFRGDRGLLAVILVLNLTHASFFVPHLYGPEVLLANRPMWLVAAVALQMVVSSSLVWYYSRRRAAELELPENRLATRFA